MQMRKCIWRNGVLFTKLHSGHIGISMMDSNTTEYIEKKNYFHFIQPLAIRNYLFLIWFWTLLNPEWHMLVCLQNDLKLVVPFFIWKFEAELHNKVMINSKEKGFICFLEINFKKLIFHWSISSSSVMNVLNANSLILKIDLD